jgi:hypothetical protein
MIGNDSTLGEKNTKLFECILCDYSTSNKTHYNRHLMTAKHINDSKMVGNDSKMVGVKSAKAYQCKCGKIYKYDSGYYRHKNSCNISNMSTNVITTDLIIELIKNNKEMIKDNKEMKQIILEQNNTINILVKNGTNNNTNSLNNNNNKTFNLQFFLNDTCKDAMNIMDFVDSIKLQLTDLERMGEVGYVEGISNIITSNLKALDVSLRPVHCTDKKRETVYIKDENEWTKEDDNKTKLRKVIKKVANKNIKLLPQFREKNPEYKNSSSRISDKYDKMVIEVMGGVGNDDLEKEDKIIRNISKNVVVEKYSE